MRRRDQLPVVASVWTQGIPGVIVFSTLGTQRISWRMPHSWAVMAIGIALKEIINSKTTNNHNKALQRSRCRCLRLLRRQIIKAFTVIKAKLIKVHLAPSLFNQGRAIQMIKVKVDAGVKFGFQTDWHPGIGCHRNNRPEEQKSIIIIKGIMWSHFPNYQMGIMWSHFPKMDVTWSCSPITIQMVSISRWQAPLIYSNQWQWMK